MSSLAEASGYVASLAKQGKNGAEIAKILWGWKFSLSDIKKALSREGFHVYRVPGNRRYCLTVSHHQNQAPDMYECLVFK